MTHRSNLNSLAEALVEKGDIKKAEEVVLFSLNKMPDEAVPYDPSAPDTVNLLFKVGQKERAVDMAQVIAERSAEVASYLIANGGDLTFELRKNLFLLGSIQRTLFENGEIESAMRYEESYMRLITELEKRTRG